MAARGSEPELPLFAEKRANDPEAALKLLATEAQGCTRCDLYKNATQTVFGEGPVDAHMMLVGEQPGDQEDLTGRPFVGPAGRVLDAALEAAGIERKSVYITNAVKHFKNEPRGKRRLHKKPDTSEIDICRFWLDNEITIVRPRIVVALGATAAAKASSPCTRLICCGSRRSATSGASSISSSETSASPAKRRAGQEAEPHTCA